MKVFISSTYKDLIEYRAAAIRAVEGTNYQASKMEVFGARPDEPLDACLKEVEESDLFIGIYALRYGFIPEGADISITEMEYLHAKKLGRPIYCFILDEDKQPWFTKWTEKEPGESKLKDFKNRIQRDHVCDYFTTPNDLRAKVSNALSHFVANHRPTEESPSPDGRGARGEGKPTGNTLPIQPYFFGREKELAIIADAISPESRTWGVLIDGPGGIGKTALAIRAAHLAPTTLFERKIFITAKVRELTPEGEKPLVDFSRDNYSSMLNELALEIGEERIPRLAPDERANPLRMAMAGKKNLIVFDNLETLSEDERTRLFQFLSRLPDGNKSIVTSRRRANVDARVIRLDRLSANETLQLIGELAKTNRRLEREHKEEWRKLYETTNGNPLFIKWVCGQLGREGSAMHTIDEACKYIGDAPEGNDPLEYIFGDLLGTFTETETKVLAALTYFNQPVRYDWVTEMASISERATETALEDLVDRSILLASKEAHKYFLPPLAAKFIRKKRAGFVEKSGDQLEKRAFALSLQYGNYDDYEGFMRLDMEWQSISAALPLVLLRDNKRVQRMYSALWQFMSFKGYLDELIWFSEQAEKKALTVRDTENAGWRAYYAGMCYHMRNEPKSVLACAARAEKHWAFSDPRLNSIAIRLRGLGYELQNNLSSALEAYTEAFNIQVSIDSESKDISITLDDLARVEQSRGNYSIAERYYNESLRIAKKVDYKEGIAEFSSHLASVHINLDNFLEAEKLAREAMELAEKIGREEVISECCIPLAIAVHKQGRSAEAIIYAFRAVEIYTRLRHKDLQKAQRLHKEIEQTTKHQETNK